MVTYTKTEVMRAINEFGKRGQKWAQHMLPVLNAEFADKTTADERRWAIKLSQTIVKGRLPVVKLPVVNMKHEDFIKAMRRIEAKAFLFADWWTEVEEVEITIPAEKRVDKNVTTTLSKNGLSLAGMAPYTINPYRTNWRTLAMLNQDKAFNRLVDYIRQNGEEVEIDGKELSNYNTVSIMRLDDLYAISDRDGWRDVVMQYYPHALWMVYQTPATGKGYEYTYNTIVPEEFEAIAMGVLA